MNELIFVCFFTAMSSQGFCIDAERANIKMDSEGTLTIMPTTRLVPVPEEEDEEDNWDD